MDRLLGAGQRLTRVQLSYGNLTQLPVEMCYALPNLESLSLWNNKIASLPPQLALLTNLTELDLTRNCLTSLPGRIVEVEGNRLECFPVEVGRMERLMAPQGRLFTTTNPLLSPSLVDQQRALPKSLPAQPTLKELAARPRLPVDLERYLDEHARCSVCGRFVWAVFVEELRYRVIRFRHMPVVYRCCSLTCLQRIDDHPT
ncbi:leucine rich repeat domain containing protein [Acanthamoeba castellanii str. Neff]|uniref:Leucine rich repeat domain containing protein n=1 Tax=Acanthamoeba castellanii (strain ATCC 30010 / Neff) TaxID=1257118 RepID=L8GQ40_ACACF|nr:leucine rich repeat domain containing protein [Acanthamoeba castellanii str. Neff]ELR15299.1 leucine rich repeat domain containing protein [Acanthamoeba castellanii str. Neff]